MVPERKKHPIFAWLALLSLVPAALPVMPGYPQQRREIELTAQEIVARVDRILEYPRGIIKGRITHISPDGASSLASFTGNIAENDFLFTFSSRDRGEQLKVLYNLGGEDIWVYNIHSIKLFHKMDIDKYDTLLATNFSYIDLSNADYQSNYNAVITGDAFVKGHDTHRLRLDPIFKGGSYGMITLYADKKEFVPLRVDFHDNDKVIFKSLSVARTLNKNGRIVPVRYDMLDIRRGTVSILEIFSIDEKAVFNKTMFYHQKLGETE
jgi:hypothetical protein